MKLLNLSVQTWVRGAALWVGVAMVAGAAESSVMYRCPGNEYNNTLSAKAAKDKGCRTLDGAPITIMPFVKSRATPAPAVVAASGASATRIDPAEQKVRDNDARRILEAELKREEERLVAMRAEYNNGEPERRGEEKNSQKYIDRVSDMKAALARKENDIVAIKRELAKLPS